MLINGLNRLTCKTLVHDIGTRITVEALPSLRVLKDLTVAIEPFFDQYRSILPYLVNDEPVPDTERLQPQAERARFDDTTKCILCGLHELLSGVHGRQAVRRAAANRRGAPLHLRLA